MSEQPNLEAEENEGGYRWLRLSGKHFTRVVVVVPQTTNLSIRYVDGDPNKLLIEHTGSVDGDQQ